MSEHVRATALVPGEASGELLVSREPLSFWGGYDPKTGEIIDRRHPLSGVVAAGRVLVMPFTRGSSTTTAILLESIRAGTAPSAIITNRVDTFLALASIVAGELYGSAVPIVATSPLDFERFKTGEHVRISLEGDVWIDFSS